MKRIGHPPIVALSCLLSIWLCACQRDASLTDSDVPTAKVEKGDVQVKVTATGELKSLETRILAAPPVAGGTLQIVELVHTGTSVHSGDVVLRFDPSEQEYNLAQNRNDLAQAEEEIKKAHADAAVQVSSDKLALLKDKFAVRRAELDVSKTNWSARSTGRKTCWRWTKRSAPWRNWSRISSPTRRQMKRPSR